MPLEVTASVHTLIHGFLQKLQQLLLVVFVVAAMCLDDHHKWCRRIQWVIMLLKQAPRQVTQSHTERHTSRHTQIHRDTCTQAHKHTAPASGAGRSQGPCHLRTRLQTAPLPAFASRGQALVGLCQNHCVHKWCDGASVGIQTWNVP